MPPFLVHFFDSRGEFFWWQTRYFYHFVPPPIVRQKTKLAYGSNSCFLPYTILAKFQKVAYCLPPKKFSVLHKMNNKKELIHITRGIPLFTLV